MERRTVPIPLEQSETTMETHGGRTHSVRCEEVIVGRTEPTHLVRSEIIVEIAGELMPLVPCAVVMVQLVESILLGLCGAMKKSTICRIG
jgi:hypothetical protein